MIIATHPENSRFQKTSEMLPEIRKVREKYNFDFTLDQKPIDTHTGYGVYKEKVGSCGACKAKEMSNLGDKWPPLSPFKYGLIPIHKGSTGDKVRLLQNLLKQAGYDISVDGIFGAETEGAVMAFQGSVDLTPDGWVGKSTWSKLVDKVKGAKLVHPLTPLPPKPRTTIFNKRNIIIGASILTGGLALMFFLKNKEA